MQPLSVVSAAQPDDRLQFDLRAYLQRGNDVFLMDVRQWAVALKFAHISGDWQPLGTNAPAGPSAHLLGGRVPGSRVRGHYAPAGQLLADADAGALAEGLRAAQRSVPFGAAEVNDGANPRYFKVQDPRIVDPAEETGGRFPVWREAVAFDLHKAEVIDELATFLAGGACTVAPGLPQELDTARHAEAERERRRRRREELTGASNRLVAAVARGSMTDREVAGQLGALRAELAGLED